MSRPLDSRSLASTRQWHLRHGRGYYDGRALTTTDRGATLRVRDVPAYELGVVVTRCPSCGRLGVSVDGHRVGEVDTAQATTQRRAVMLVSGAGGRARTLTITALGGGRVTVQGLLVVRRAPS